MFIKEQLKKIRILHGVGIRINKIYYNIILNCISSLGMIIRKYSFICFKKYRKLKCFKNIHCGQRCFIIATGPSLTFNDLENLKNEKTFGMNSIIKVLAKTNWIPTYYGIQDEKVYEKLQEDILQSDLKNIFLSNNISKKFQVPQNSIIYSLHYLNHRYGYNSSYSTKFSSDCYNIVYDGYTITYSLIQIAIYMGFKEIYLLGCDCNYSDDKNKQHFVESGHYDPAYKTAGERMITAYKVAKEYADAHGIKIYNATRGGMLEVFPRVDIDAILGVKDNNEFNRKNT